MKRRPAAFPANDLRYPAGAEIIKAAETLAEGGLVAFPTETCYGFAVDPFNENALRKLFQLKKRPAEKPVLLLISELSQLELLAAKVPGAYRPLMERYWPGPLTLIFPARPELSLFVTGGTGTVGVRISPHPVAQALGRAFCGAITATSANLSGFSPARSAAEIRTFFDERVDIILDGGIIPVSLCSTIVCETEGKLQLVRSGVIRIAEFSLAGDTSASWKNPA